MQQRSVLRPGCPAGRAALNLPDALRASDASSMLRLSLGESFAAAYVRLQMPEWNADTRHLSRWQREATLDC